MKTLKSILIMFVIVLSCTSCEPEEITLPKENKNLNFDHKVGETGDQEKTMDEKTP